MSCRMVGMLFRHLGVNVYVLCHFINTGMLFSLCVIITSMNHGIKNLIY